MVMPVREIKRTFNINNYENITVTGIGTHDNDDVAYMLAELDCLDKAKITMYRIFITRESFNCNDEYDHIAYNKVISEIDNINNILQSFKLKPTS